MIMQQSTQVLPVRPGRVPWAVHALSTHQCAMSPLRRFTLYFGLAPQYGPVHPASASIFIGRLPSLFVVPYCKATVLVGGGKRCPRGCLSPGYRLGSPYPWYTTYPLQPFPHVPSQGYCCPPPPSPLPGALPCGVVPDSAGPLFV
jgi:hypothetical protein